MKRAERQYALVDLLRGADRPWSATRLAVEFGVSRRTVERDIMSLQQAGVPVYADRGRAGGYSILREYSLPPLNLSAAESSAVLAGLALLDASPYQAPARRARAKIAAVMREEHRSPVRERLAATHVIAAGVTHDAHSITLDASLLDMLSDAIAVRRVLRMAYLGDDPRRAGTVRDVEPLGVLRADDAWLLIGWCRLRDAIRGFRLDRITRLESLDETAPWRDPALVDADLARWPTRRLA